MKIAMPQNVNEHDNDDIDNSYSGAECANHSLDARGLRCPLPLIKVKLALRELDLGQTLYVQASDPGSAVDIPVYLSKVGHKLLSHGEHAGVHSFLIQK